MTLRETDLILRGTQMRNPATAELRQVALSHVRQLRGMAHVCGREGRAQFQAQEEAKRIAKQEARAAAKQAERARRGGIPQSIPQTVEPDVYE